MSGRTIATARGGRTRSARSAATEILVEVLASGRSLDASLAGTARTDGLAPVPGEERDLAFTRELCHGVLRWRPRLDAVARELLARPLRRRDLDIHILLLLGLYQLIYTRVPAHAAVSETVQETRRRDKPWAAALVNGALRRFIRESTCLLGRVDGDPVARWAHPPWLLERIRDAWPRCWETVLAANNARAPMTLRVNARHGPREAYLERLSARGLRASTVPHAPRALMLERPVAVETLPGFDQGWVSVQDAAAQLAAALVSPAPGERVLDACAAPGGKAAHLLELQPCLGQLTAVEKDERRVALLTGTLNRVGAGPGSAVRVVHGDVGRPHEWWDGRAYDRILLDVPCTATGVIRRHPDIKSLRRLEDIEAMAKRQLDLLRAVWPLLARGGQLLYATCSILPSENDGVVGRFAAEHEDVEVVPIRASWGSAGTFGRQVLPGEDEMDGFYYAQAVKR